MHKKFEINRTKIKGGCQSGRKVVTHNSKIDLPLRTTDTRVLHILMRERERHFTSRLESSRYIMMHFNDNENAL